MINYIAYIISVLVGIIVGLIFAAKIYLKHKTKRFYHLVHDNVLDKKEEKNIQNIVHNTLKYHNKTKYKKIKLFFGLIRINKKIDYKALNLKYFNLDKYQELSFVEELYQIAKLSAFNYYQVDNPIFEISIKDITDVIDNILLDIKAIIKDIDIIDINNMRLSSIKNSYHVVKKAKRITENENFIISFGLLNLLVHLGSIFSPAYWIKKFSMRQNNNALINSAVYLTFLLVSCETSKTYKKIVSKNT